MMNPEFWSWSNPADSEVINVPYNRYTEVWIGLVFEYTIRLD